MKKRRKEMKKMKKVRAVASRLQINFFARSEPPLGKEIVDRIAEFWEGMWRLS